MHAKETETDAEQIGMVAVSLVRAAATAKTPANGTLWPVAGAAEQHHDAEGILCGR